MDTLEFSFLSLLSAIHMVKKSSMELDGSQHYLIIHIVWCTLDVGRLFVAKEPIVHYSRALIVRFMALPFISLHRSLKPGFSPSLSLPTPLSLSSGNILHYFQRPHSA